MKKMEIEKIRTTVETQFRELFPKEKLVKVEVEEEEEDRDGDETLNIIVVFDGKKLLGGKRTLELTWRVRRKLEKDEDRFLTFGFCIKEEAGELGIALP